MSGSPTVESAEAKLTKLLAEAAAAHEAVDFLMTKRPPLAPQDPAGQLVLQGTSTALLERLQRLVPMPRPNAADPSLSAAAAPLLEATAAMGHEVRQALLGVVAVQRREEPEAGRTLPLRASRAHRTTARFAREAEEANRLIAALDAENSQLREELAAAHRDLDASASLRDELAASRAREHGLVRQLDAQQHALKEAEAEQERLRTLLAAFSWYQAQA